MAASSIRAAAERLSELNALCVDFLDDHPDEAPPAPLLRAVACAGRELVNAIGEHLATTHPRH